MEDLYEILEIHRDATSIEIRKAYKRMALHHHPDKVPESERVDAEARFKLISEAYETLINPDTRAHYDNFGTSASDIPGWQDYYDPGFGPDAFAEFFGFSTPQPHARKSASTAFDIEVTLEDAYKGRLFKLASTRQVICKTCNGCGGRSKAKPKICAKCQGSGMVEKLKPLAHGLMTSNRVPCDACNGKGSIYRSKDLCKKCTGKTTVEEKSVLEVTIPKGVKTGHKIVFRGKADEHPGQETGDIVVNVTVLEHAIFRRHGNDLSLEVLISLREALTGFSRVLVKHLDGRGLKLTVPRGQVTKPNSILKVKNEGLCGGDLYIHVDVEFPCQFEPSLVDSLSRTLPEDPNSEPFRGEFQNVDHKIVSDLPEYRESSPKTPPTPPQCAQM